MTDKKAETLYTQACSGIISARKNLVNLAEKGDATAMLLLAQLHDEIGPVEIDQDLELARRWYKKSAELGNATAQLCFANMCHYGQGGSLDLATAFKWYKAAADQGEVESQMHVGRFYQTGLVDDIDIEAAKHWYEIAARNGHELAATNLGNIVYNTAQDDEDYKEAFALFSFAAGKGDGLAHLMLGEMSINGQGTKIHGGQGLLHYFIAEALLLDGDNRKIATDRKEFYLAQHPNVREEFSEKTNEYLEGKGFDRIH